MITIIITVCTVISKGQNLSNITVESKVLILDNEERLKEERNGNIRFAASKKGNKNYAELTITRIKRNVKFANVETFDTDTVRYESGRFEIDTDNPIPTGEDDKILIENLVSFVENPMVFSEVSNGSYEKPRVKPGSPDIEQMFVKKIPTLNQQIFLSPIMLNFDNKTTYKADTVLSDIYGGILVTVYEKSEDGFKIKGKLNPVQSSTSQADGNIAIIIYENFSYEGSIVTEQRRIKKIDLNVMSKSRTVFKSINLDEPQTEEYRILITNEFIDN